LWYTPYIPYLFFVSCLAGGLAMLVVESLLSHRVFGHQVEADDHEKIDRLTVGLGKAGAFTLFAYFALKVLAFLHGYNWVYLPTKWGALWLVEMGGFVLLPMLMFLKAVRTNDARMVRWASVLTVLGVMVNRFIISMVALNWNAPETYIPSWMEIMVSLTIATIAILVFKWVMNRMPVLYRLPDFPDEH
ncbi:MAG: NrfD/PsrC family molybdoenzyme membrane anchor subunit, partial [Alphaproteobacteria bacterium]